MPYLPMLPYTFITYERYTQPTLRHVGMVYPGSLCPHTLPYTLHIPGLFLRLRAHRALFCCPLSRYHHVYVSYYSHRTHATAGRAYATTCSSPPWLPMVAVLVAVCRVPSFGQHHPVLPLHSSPRPLWLVRCAAAAARGASPLLTGSMSTVGTADLPHHRVWNVPFVYPLPHARTALLNIRFTLHLPSPNTPFTGPPALLPFTARGTAYFVCLRTARTMPHFPAFTAVSITTPFTAYASPAPPLHYVAGWCISFTRVVHCARFSPPPPHYTASSGYTPDARLPHVASFTHAAGTRAALLHVPVLPLPRGGFVVAACGVGARRAVAELLQPHLPH